VSTADQTCENQLLELRRYCEARGLEVVREFVDHGVSGAKDRRPALDELLTDARRRRFDMLVCWRLDRLGRSLRHLVMLLEDLQAAGVNFVSLNEGIDLATPSGRLQLHILAALAEFERSRIQERVRAGLARARAQGKRLGRPRLTPPPDAFSGLSVRRAAELWGVSKSTAARRLARGPVPMGQSPQEPA
jgi:DNA invertase Pin-like site-specific DNA recombinase